LNLPYIILVIRFLVFYTYLANTAKYMPRIHYTVPSSPRAIPAGAESRRGSGSLKSSHPPGRGEPHKIFPFLWRSWWACAGGSKTFGSWTWSTH